MRPLVKVAKAGGAVAVDFDETVTIDADGTENPKMRELVEELDRRGVAPACADGRRRTSIRPAEDMVG